MDVNSKSNSVSLFHLSFSMKKNTPILVFLIIYNNSTIQSDYRYYRNQKIFLESFNLNQHYLLPYKTYFTVMMGL
ncbi:hypothetical protein pb186bvf_007341 [Paramecium bursaria]